MIDMKRRALELQIAILKQMLMLATGGFGIAAALAWNDLIKNFIEIYIKPYVSQGSGIVANLIYAVAITAIAVLVTLQLGKILAHLERKEEVSQEA